MSTRISDFIREYQTDWSYEESAMSLILTSSNYHAAKAYIRPMKLRKPLILRVAPAIPLSSMFNNKPFPVLQAIEGDEKDLFIVNLHGREQLIRTLGLHSQESRLRPWRIITQPPRDLSISDCRWITLIQNYSKDGMFKLRS